MGALLASLEVIFHCIPYSKLSLFSHIPLVASSEERIYGFTIESRSVDDMGAVFCTEEKPLPG